MVPCARSIGGEFRGMNTLPDARDTAQTRLPTGRPHSVTFTMGCGRRICGVTVLLMRDCAVSLMMPPGGCVAWLADDLRTLGLCPTTPRHDLDKFSFLAETTDDIANALNNGVTAVRASWDAEDPDPPPRKNRGKNPWQEGGGEGRRFAEAQSPLAWGRAKTKAPDAVRLAPAGTMRYRGASLGETGCQFQLTAPPPKRGGFVAAGLTQIRWFDNQKFTERIPLLCQHGAARK
jgi:hypothetical protein